MAHFMPLGSFHILVKRRIMIKKLYFLPLFLLACNTATNKGNEVTAEGNEVQDVRVIDPVSSIAGCYTGVLQRDTAELTLQHTPGGTSVSGDFEIRNFEKDGSRGTLNGHIEDSLIISYYDYYSEGMKSVAEVIFKIKGDTLLQAYGDVRYRGDTVIFAKPQQLKFMTEKPFIKRDCK